MSKLVAKAEASEVFSLDPVVFDRLVVSQRALDAAVENLSKASALCALLRGRRDEDVGAEHLGWVALMLETALAEASDKVDQVQDTIMHTCHPETKQTGGAR